MMVDLQDDIVSLAFREVLEELIVGNNNGNKSAVEDPLVWPFPAGTAQYADSPGNKNWKMKTLCVSLFLH